MYCLDGSAGSLNKKYIHQFYNRNVLSPLSLLMTQAEFGVSTSSTSGYKVGFGIGIETN